MVSVLALNVVDHGFKGQTKEHEIYICCFSTQNLGVRTKMGWLEIRNVSEWSNVSTNGLLFQCLSGAMCLPMSEWSDVSTNV
jgi:hypothetical protein